jgi:putative oxygen-independent coproporphyrinogen III oxidase
MPGTLGGVPSALPTGEPVPADGSLPPRAREPAPNTGLGLYVHVPFCASRCGYCDFNTYTFAELGAEPAQGQHGSDALPVPVGAGPADYVQAALAEMALARTVLGPAGRALSSVYFGGGTPTVLPSRDLACLLAAARDLFGFAPDAEITTEANPESVDERSLTALRAAGVNRLSLGMQSATAHVLLVLDRRHEPGSVGRAVRAARSAGFDNLSLDLIYGTPGESAADWQASLDAALALGPDHVSAYALVVEPGTRLARRVARGEVAAPDDDDLADKYLQADAALAAAGLGWYEVSNWGRPCRHNLGYWRGADWWGIGPGAHSHIGGVRWWNFKHPAAYARRLAEGRSPGQGREVLDARTRRVERILLETRLAGGLPLDVVPGAGRAEAAAMVTEGLADPPAFAAGRVVLTPHGRLLADAVVRRLVGD